MGWEPVLLPPLGSFCVAREGSLSLLTEQANKTWSPGSRPSRIQWPCSHLLQKIPKNKLGSFFHPFVSAPTPTRAAFPAASPEQRQKENKGVKKVNKDASARRWVAGMRLSDINSYPSSTLPRTKPAFSIGLHLSQG